ncbi:transposase [Methylomonas sp. AM2-LC]|uniref:transposase n=1 Tax=Methylomonas sp. AM2-LC TaxID=3153301 RepID=UPI003265DC06
MEVNLSLCQNAVDIAFRVPHGFLSLILPNRLLADNIDILREVFAEIQKQHLFRMDAVVVLPDHLHCIWTLPEDDANLSIHWNMLKGVFSKKIEKRRKNFSQPEV